MIDGAATGTVGLPYVGRFGLAHSLLAWARCQVWCGDRGLAMLSPNWNHLRVGPYLRREADKREYHRLFTFPHYVSGVRRAWLLCTLPKIAVELMDPAVPLDTSRRRIVVFSNRVTGNFEAHFHEIAGRGPQLQSALRRMTRPCFLPDPTPERHIALHVRMGDFTTPSSQSELRRGQTNSRLPLDWFTGSLRQLRRDLGRDVPAVVFSDGSDEALAPLLALPGVRRSPGRSAVTDLLSIASASVLVSSGSGFSIWGAFLGSVPRICFPGQRIVRALGDVAALDLEPEVDFDQPIPSDFMAHVARGLA